MQSQPEQVSASNQVRYDTQGSWAGRDFARGRAGPDALGDLLLLRDYAIFFWVLPPTMGNKPATCSCKSFGGKLYCLLLRRQVALSRAGRTTATKKDL